MTDPDLVGWAAMLSHRPIRFAWALLALSFPLVADPSNGLDLFREAARLLRGLLQFLRARLPV